MLGKLKQVAVIFSLFFTTIAGVVPSVQTIVASAPVAIAAATCFSPVAVESISIDVPSILRGADPVISLRRAEARAATGDITSVTVRSDGWSADVVISGFTLGGSYNYNLGTNNDPTNAKFVFTVTSLGYDQTGTATSVQRTVYGVQTIRVPYSTSTIPCANPVTSWSGTFTNLETITQATSGATAVILGVGQSSGGKLRVRTVSSSPAADSSHVWNGATASFTPNAAPTQIMGTSGASTVYDELASSTPNLTVRVCLSDYIYQKDTANVTVAAGWCTNAGGASQTSNALSSTAATISSTVAYPKVIGHWAVEQRRPVNAATDVEMICAHKYSRNNCPVACVKMTAAGASSMTSNSVTITAQSQSSRADKLPVYKANFNLSTSASPAYTRGEALNIDFVAYPWIGDSGATLSSSADAGGSTFQLGTLVWTVMDKMICVVDPSNISGTASDSTGVASTSQVTADAGPYCLTWQGAALKIAAANNLTYTLNRIDGGEIQLKAGTYTWNKTGASASVNGYFSLVPHSSTNRAGVLMDTGTPANGSYNYQRWYNLTINRASGGFLVFAASTNTHIMEKINVIDAFGQWYSGDNNTNLEFLDCATTNATLSRGGNDGRARLIRNCKYVFGTDGSAFGGASCVLASSVTGTAFGGWGMNSGMGTNNYLMAYNQAISSTDTQFFNSTIDGSSNIALIGNLIERIGSSAQGLQEIDSANISNLVVTGNTWIGQRMFHENILAAASNKNITDYSAQYNIWCRGNHRVDVRVLVQDGTMVGYWPTDYSIGFHHNFNWTKGGYAGDEDFWGTFSNTTALGTNSFGTDQTAGFVKDASQESGDNTGGGLYMPTLGSTVRVNRVPAGQAARLTDLNGVYIPNNGTATIGAIQPYNQSFLLGI